MGISWDKWGWSLVLVKPIKENIKAKSIIFLRLAFFEMKSKKNMKLVKLSFQNWQN